MKVFLIQTRSRLRGSAIRTDWTNWETMYVDEDINNAEHDVKRHQSHQTNDDLLENEYRYLEIDYYPSTPIYDYEEKN